MILATIVDPAGAPQLEEEHGNTLDAWRSLRDAYIRSMDHLGREVNGYVLLIFSVHAESEGTITDPDGYRYSVTPEPNLCAGGEWSGGRWLACAVEVDHEGDQCPRHLRSDNLL